jgi:hypothetical protein
VTLPIGAEVSFGAAGAGMEYQFSRETKQDLAGHLIRASFAGAWKGVQFSIGAERQTHAPTAGYVIAQVPWLEEAVNRLGVTANTSTELAELLRTNAALSALGYASGVPINLTPVRSRLTAGASWAGSGAARPQLSLSTVFNRDELIDRTSRGAVHTVTYSQRIASRSDILVTSSFLCLDRASRSSPCRPSVSVSFRQTLNSMPRVPLLDRGGEISGTIFRDDDGRGVYASGMCGIAGVEVILDGARRTRSDASGRFRFAGLRPGRHWIEARHTGEQPYFFTTPSPVEVRTGATVNFGLGFALARMRGLVLSDARTGLPDVVIHAVTGQQRFTTHTEGDGSFVFDGLPPGVYDVSVGRGSLSTGYALDELVPQRVTIDVTTPGRVSFVVRAFRNVTGRVRLFDHASGVYVPLSGTVVEIFELQRRCTSDAAGLYLFRDLPAGEYTLVTRYRGRTYAVPLSFGTGPTTAKDVNISIVPPRAGNQDQESDKR